MARRKELGSLANGLVKSFVSRNNDVEGYWGIGKLYQLANAHNTKTITLNLLSEEASPELEILERVAQTYSRRLAFLVDAYGGCITWLQAAEITVSFHPDAESERHHSMETTTVGDPYACHCHLVDDQGKAYTASAGGRCWPHDPSRERNRKENSTAN